jgi:hypothetical protein
MGHVIKLTGFREAGLFMNDRYIKFISMEGILLIVDTKRFIERVKKRVRIQREFLEELYRAFLPKELFKPEEKKEII